MIYNPEFDDKNDIFSTREFLCKLLPSLSKFELVSVNLNDLVRDYFKIHPEKDTVEYRLDPRIQQMIIDKLYPVLDNVCVYGGWMENRKDLWKGTYMDKDSRYVHLGIDLMADAESSAHSPLSGIVEDIFIDKDVDVGWGGRIILRPFDDKLPLLVLGHLEPKIFPFLGNTVKPGDFLGKIGKPPTNGNVFEHIHLQAISREFAEEIDFNYGMLDGYGVAGDIKLARNNPDPLSFSWH